MREIRVGVAGVGVLGSLHARLYGACEGVTLAGVHDSNAETAARVAAELQVPVFATIPELAAAVDGVSVAVPTDRHFELVQTLLELDRHVLVEKPITTTVEQARQLVQQARDRNVVLQVGHLERFNPVLDCLREVPGTPRFIEAHRLAPYPPPRPRLLPRGTEVSVVLDLMIHDIDVVLSLVNSDIETVEAVGVPVLSDTEDIANARLQFQNGGVANLTASRVSQERMRKIRVFKSSAYLSLDYQDHKGVLARKGATGIDWAPVPVHDGNALQAELEDFCRCIRGCLESGPVAEPRVSGEQGLRALTVAEAIIADIAARNDRDTGQADDRAL